MVPLDTESVHGDIIAPQLRGAGLVQLARLEELGLLLAPVAAFAVPPACAGAVDLCPPGTASR